MGSTFWLFVSIAGSLVFVYAIIALILRWRKGNVNYRNLYTVGLSLLPLGIIFIAEDILFGFLYFIVSLVLIGIGLKNKDKWQEVTLTEEQMKRKRLLLILVIAGLVALFTYLLISFIYEQQ